MNFIRIFQLSALILLEVCRATVGSDQPADCTINPTNVDKVDVVVYINGGTPSDEAWYSTYCSWMASGFPYKDYAPVIVNVGGEITCDENNKCNCPNKDSDLVHCAATFQHICLLQSLGQNEFLDLLCCSVLVDEDNQFKGLQACVDDHSGLADKVRSCMNDKGPGNPQAVALLRAKEVAEKGVDMANNSEPFFFYNGTFDKCISDDSVVWFLQKICAMLKHDIAINITQCVEAMGW